MRYLLCWLRFIVEYCLLFSKAVMSADSLQVAGLLHVRESGRIGLKVHVVAGSDLYAIPICLKSAIRMNVFDDALNVLGLTAAHIKNGRPPSGKLRWLYDPIQCLAPPLSSPSSCC